MSDPTYWTTDNNPDTNPGLDIRISRGWDKNPPPRYQPPPEPEPAMPEQPIQRSKPATITQARRRLKAESLAGLVDEHRAIGKQRLLRFKPGTTAEQRFSVYAALGLARDSKPLPTKRSQPAPQTKSAPSTNQAPSAA